MTEKRTDLALEARESFPRNHVEIQGVVLEKKKCLQGKVKITTVIIRDEAGSKAMKKPKGTYITIESPLMLHGDIDEREPFLLCVCEQLESMIKGLRKEEFGASFMKENGYGCVSAIAPGVMAQTGIETEEVLQGIIRKTKPDLVIVVDALASRSVQRLCTTVQITDTGIEPGAGVGNRRKELTKKTLGIPVVAIGVPTVVDAATIISDHLEHVLEKQGYSEEEIERFIYEILTEETTDVMVTPKNIDESVNQISKDLAKVLNHCFQKRDNYGSSSISFYEKEDMKRE